MKILRSLALVLALAAMAALAIPALASASKIEKEPSHELVKVGEPLSLFHTGADSIWIKSSVFGRAVCESFTAVGFTLSKNDGTTVEGSSSSPGAATCSTPSGGGSNVFSFSDLEIQHLAMTTPENGTMTLSYTQQFGPNHTCHFAGTVHFTYPLPSGEFADHNRIQIPEPSSYSLSAEGCGKESLYGEVSVWGSERLVLNN